MSYDNGPEGVGYGARRGSSVWRWTAIAALVAAAAAYGYWRYVYYPRTPQYALREFLDAAKNHDYETAYGRLHITSPLKLVVPSARALETFAENAGGLIPQLVSYRLGKVEQTAEGVRIMTMLTTEDTTGEAQQARTDVTEVSIELRQVDNTWKVDAGWAMREMVKRGGTDLLRSLFR